MKRWVSGPYDGTLSQHGKGVLKLKMTLNFKGEAIAGQGEDEALTEFRVSGTVSTRPPYGCTIRLDSPNFGSVELEGFRGADDEIFGNWTDAIDKPKEPLGRGRGRGRGAVPLPNFNGEDDDEVAQPRAPLPVPSPDKPVPAPGGRRGNFSFKLKKPSQAELDAIRQRDLAGKLDSLVGMGFDTETAQKALDRSGGSLEVAMEALLNPASMVAAGGLGGGQRGSAAPAASAADVQRLLDMGFARDQAEQALAASNNNVELAADILLSQ